MNEDTFSVHVEMRSEWDSVRVMVRCFFPSLHSNITKTILVKK